MTHFIAAKSLSKVVTLAATAAFVLTGFSPEAKAQPYAKTADQTGLFANQNYGIQTPQGTNLTWFQVDGTCNGIAEVKGGRRISYKCRYEAVQIDDGRVALTVRSDLDGYRTASSETLSLMPDGNLFNETAQSVAYRLRADGIPISSTRGRR